MTQLDAPKSQSRRSNTTPRTSVEQSVQRFRLLLAAAAFLYPVWALVLLHDAPTTNMGFPQRFLVAGVCLGLIVASHRSAFIARQIEGLAFLVALAINSNNAYLVYANHFNFYYVYGYILCVFGISIAFESGRFLLGYLLTATISAIFLHTEQGETSFVMFLSATVVTGLMSIICFYDKLWLLQALKRQNGEEETSRLMLNETQRLAKLGGWSYHVPTERLWWSEQMYTIYDLPLKTRLKLDEVLNYFLPEVQDLARGKIRAAIEAGAPFDVELPLRTAAGQLIWTRMTCTVENDGDKVERLIGCVQDITKEHRLSDELIARETSARAVIDAIPGQVSWLDSDLCYLGVNQSLASTFKLEPEHFIGQKLGFQHGQRLDQLATFVRALFASSEPSSSAQVMLEFPGEAKRVFLLSAQKYHGGKEAVIVGIDITERHRMEKELAEQRELLTAVLDHMPLGLHAKDATDSYRYIIWNRAMAKLAGIAADQVLGKTDHALYTIEAADRQRRVDSEVMATRQMLDTGEEVLAFPRGQVPVHAVRVPVYRADGSPRMVLSVTEDMTEKKQREELIAAQQAQLMHASKMSTLGEMSGGVAHEINNPLTIITGYAGRIKTLIDAGGDLDSRELLRCVTKISNTTERIARIVRGLRTFAREASQDPFEPFAIGGILADTLELCEQRFANNGVKLSVPDPFPDLTIACRPVQISQVLLNLLNNAYDAVLEQKERWVELTIEDRGDCVVFAVTDGGPRIPDQVAARLMQPFFTTKGIGKGTGLGLSISRGIIESHGGTFHLDREHPHTRFVFVLPKEQTALPEVPQAA